jgi:hypothetical protein
MILLISFLREEKFFLFRSSLMMFEVSKSFQLNIDFWDFWFKNLFSFQFEFYSMNKITILFSFKFFFEEMIFLGKMNSNFLNKLYDHVWLCMKDYLKEILEN